MPRFPAKPETIYADINKRYFSGLLPEEVDFLWVSPNATVLDADGHSVFNGKEDMASTVGVEGGGYVISIHSGLKGFVKLLYLVLCHEALHVWFTSRGENVEHGSKRWNERIDDMVQKGLMRRVF